MRETRIEGTIKSRDSETVQDGRTKRVKIDCLKEGGDRQSILLLRSTVYE